MVDTKKKEQEERKLSMFYRTSNKTMSQKFDQTRALQKEAH